MADPGIPVGGPRPPMWALFGKNICEDERTGSRMGGVRQFLLNSLVQFFKFSIWTYQGSIFFNL